MNLGKLHQGVHRPVCFASVQKRNVAAKAAASQDSNELGFKMMRRGVKEAANETVLSPRFYTTDFDETEEMFS